MNVIALDLSLTSTGVCLADGSSHVIKTKASDQLEARLGAIVDGVVEALNQRDSDRTDLVVIEDMVTASKFSGAVAPVHGAVRLYLWNWDYPMALVSPASLKLYGGGKGNCDKDAMKVQAMKRAGVDFSGRGDECDAWWLRAMALDAYGKPVVDVPANQRAALEKVQWPNLKENAR